MNRLIIFLALILIHGSVLTQEFTTPLSYMEYIDKEHTEISKDLMKYVSTAAHSRRAKKIERKRKQLVSTVSKAKDVVANMPGFEGDASYRNATFEYLRICLAVMQDDYAKIVDMEEVAEQSYDLMEAYILTKQKASKKTEKAVLDQRVAMVLFATKHNIKVVEREDDLSKKIEKTGDVSDYMNQVYLTFFKSFIDQQSMFAALGTGNISEAERFRVSMKLNAEEGINKLKKLGAFDSDQDLNSSCANLLQYFVEVGDNEIQSVFDFYSTKASFEEIQREIENTKSKDRTQEQIDKYNALVPKFNEAVNTYNQVNQAINTKTNQLLNAYNEAQVKFIDKHIPKY